ncbi:unnamed protein product [Lactuca saligna]|uniref:Uncharacterized protein n=1 Tax=Lactuca saligna TaxID=75948 RepID=A0AA35V735_LACSI|nr:unnamed protein product [Lactuca saligna]
MEGNINMGSRQSRFLGGVVATLASVIMFIDEGLTSNFSCCRRE